MTERTVVVLGGGTGGVVAARRLRRALAPEDRVVLVERDPVFRFGPSFLWVLSGTRRPEQVTRDVRALRRRGIEVVESEVIGIDPAERSVTTAAGALQADRIVVALGAELAPAAMPGFAEAAHNFFTLEGARTAGTALGSLGGGRVVVLVARPPYKCPAAPWEAAFLSESVLRRRGVPGVSVDVYTPEPFPMPTAGRAIGDGLVAMLSGRGIGVHPERQAERIDPDAHEVVFADGERVPYDLLLGVPPHRPPAVARESGLAPETGFVPADPATLATTADGVYAIGDVTAVPIAGGKFLPKAGVFAEAQAEIVARRIADELSGRTPSATFDGKGACFVELGDGRAAFAAGGFYGADGPEIRMRGSGRHWHLAKVALEQIWLRRWI